jgi:glycine cleavage system regulatory protein
MSDKLNSIITEFRNRAAIQKLTSIGAIIGTVGVIVFGLYIFIYVSPKIAALDIEEQRKVSSGRQDAINTLSALNIEIRRNNERIHEIEKQIRDSQEFIIKDGNLEIELDYRINYHTSSSGSSGTEMKTMNIDELRDLHSKIISSTEKIKQEKKEKIASKKIRTVVQNNEVAIAKVEEYLAKVEANLKEHTEKVQKLPKEKSALHDKNAFLAAKRQLTTTPADKDKLSSEAAKMTFYLSANLARFGIVVITIFFAQVFISIFRYSSRLSAFYHARADILELVAQTELFKGTEIAQLLEEFSRIFTPDSIDYGKPTKTNIDDSLKTLAGLVKQK